MFTYPRYLCRLLYCKRYYKTAIVFNFLSLILTNNCALHKSEAKCSVCCSLRSPKKEGFFAPLKCHNAFRLRLHSYSPLLWVVNNKTFQNKYIIYSLAVTYCTRSLTKCYRYEMPQSIAQKCEFEGSMANRRQIRRRIGVLIWKLDKATAINGSKTITTIQIKLL